MDKYQVCQKDIHTKRHPKRRIKRQAPKKTPRKTDGKTDENETGGSSQGEEARIIRGEEAKRGAWPWQVISMIYYIIWF